MMIGLNKCKIYLNDCIYQYLKAYPNLKDSYLFSFKNLLFCFWENLFIYLLISIIYNFWIVCFPIRISINIYLFTKFYYIFGYFATIFLFWLLLTSAYTCAIRHLLDIMYYVLPRIKSHIIFWSMSSINYWFFTLNTLII